MKKSFAVYIVLLIIVIVWGLCGCSISKNGLEIGLTKLEITAPIPLKDGTIVNATVKVTRLPFVMENFSYNPISGTIDFVADQSLQFNQGLSNVTNFAATAASLYGRSMGIPAPTPQIPTVQNAPAVAVPKPQATPPPTEGTP